ncbi:MAG: XRE family transcriptional regulator [Acidimicrobiales bacterium]|nr:MAG: XRE family transcriptional regulator [Acidimicrobiales bacterium]
MLNDVSDQRTSERCESLRQRLAMTQTEFASLVGVSQAAVSQFESGSRSPGGRTSAFYDRLEAAIRSDVVTETIDGRTTTMPAHPWVRVIDPGDVGTLALPARLDWSPRMSSGWDYADEVHRREIYRIVVDVGDALDIEVFTDPDELLEWSLDLNVARRVQPAFDRLIERLAAVSSRA